MRPRRGKVGVLAGLVAIAIVMWGCDSSAPSGASPSTIATPSVTVLATAQAPAASRAVRHLSLVAIGDSLAHGQGQCASCTDYVDLYGQALSAATGVPVDVQNLAAIELSALPPVESTSLLNDILSDAALRRALAGADVVVISVGFNDTPWNRFDDPCDAANADLSVIHWNKITPACISRVAADYKQTLDEILTQIDQLRGCYTPAGQPVDFCRSIGKSSTLIRVVTVFNDWIGDSATPVAANEPTGATDRGFVAAQCFEMSVHGGRCADAYHVLNGPTGTSDAGPFLLDDHTHLNQAGHQAVANALAALGYAPLH